MRGRTEVCFGGDLVTQETIVVSVIPDFDPQRSLPLRPLRGVVKEHLVTDGLSRVLLKSMADTLWNLHLFEWPQLHQGERMPSLRQNGY